METEATLLCTQLLAICPYPEPDQYWPCLPSYLFKVHSNTTLPSTPRSSKWFLSLRFPHQNPVCTSSLPQTWHQPSLSHTVRFDHPNNLWSSYNSWRSWLCSLLYSLFPWYLVPLTPSIFLSALFWKIRIVEISLAIIWIRLTLKLDPFQIFLLLRSVRTCSMQQTLAEVYV